MIWRFVCTSTLSWKNVYYIKAKEIEGTDCSILANLENVLYEIYIILLYFSMPEI